MIGKPVFYRGDFYHCFAMTIIMLKPMCTILFCRVTFCD